MRHNAPSLEEQLRLAMRRLVSDVISWMQNPLHCMNISCTGGYVPIERSPINVSPCSALDPSLARPACTNKQCLPLWRRSWTASTVPSSLMARRAQARPTPWKAGTATVRMARTFQMLQVRSSGYRMTSCSGPGRRLKLSSVPSIHMLGQVVVVA